MAITYHAGRRIQGLSKSTTVANTKPISSQTTNVIDLAVKPDGTEIYVATEDTGKVITYELAIAGDVSTAVYNSSKDYTHSLTNPKGMDWNNDGTKIYLASFNSEAVHTYTVSTAYDLSSTVTQVGTGDDLSGIDGAQALQWSHDGAYLFQADNSGVIFRYQVSSAFVVSDGTRTSFNPSETTAVTGISFGDNGKEMYIVSHANTGLFKYTLSTAYDLSTATHDSTLTTTDADNQGIATSNGKIYVLGQTTDIVTDYNNDIKPSNVQAGSRMEETDTRKIYHKVDTVTGSDVSLTGLNAYFKFNEASGDLINHASNVGSTDEIAGNGTNSNVTYSQTGKIGSTYSYNGTDSKTEIDTLIPTSQTGSVFWWWKSSDGIDVIWGWGDTNADTFIFQEGTGSGESFTIYARNGGANKWWAKPSSNISSPLNTWHSAAITHDGTAPLIYVDGVEGTTFTNSSDKTWWVPDFSGIDNFSLGFERRNNGLHNYFNGNIDELSVWSRALTAAEISTLHNSGTGKEINSDVWKEEGT